ncbi:MAG: hypothetical protein V7711_07060 [Pseudomonadales bacterium]
MFVGSLLRAGLLLIAATLIGCSSSPPSKPNDLCDIFREKRDWYKAAVKSSERWGAPIQVPMAIMYQESSYQDDARPPMRWALGFIPYGRASSAYGYSQAKTPAWGDYTKATGNRGADRDDFADAMDFIQWYIDRTRKINGISKWDAYGQYLAYHEGNGGYSRKTYNAKPWLIKVARKVDDQAKKYGAQYRGCEKELSKGWVSRLFS